MFKTNSLLILIFIFISSPATSSTPMNYNTFAVLNLELESNLNRVDPQCMAFKSWPCQLQAAHIRNETVNAIESSDIGMVAYRYLQSRSGQYNTCFEAFVHCSAFICILLIMKNDDNYLGLASIGATIELLQGIINIKNTRRYQKTKKVAEIFLMSKMSHESFQQFKKLSNTQQGLTKLVRLLHREGIDTTNLSTKIQNKFNFELELETESLL